MELDVANTNKRTSAAPINKQSVSIQATYCIWVLSPETTGNAPSQRNWVQFGPCLTQLRETKEPSEQDFHCEFCNYPESNASKDDETSFGTFMWL